MSNKWIIPTGMAGKIEICSMTDLFIFGIFAHMAGMLLCNTVRFGRMLGKYKDWLVSHATPVVEFMT